MKSAAANVAMALSVCAYVFLGAVQAVLASLRSRVYWGRLMGSCTQDDQHGRIYIHLEIHVFEKNAGC